MKHILLYSGGMDSLIAYYYLKERLESLDTLYVKLRHKYQGAEVRSILATLPHTAFLGLNIGIFEKDDAEIPMRNLYLAMLAANAGADRIYLVVQKDEMSIPDRTPEFMQEAGSLISSLVQREVKVTSPFTHLDKVEMVSWFLHEGYDSEELKKTWACYQDPIQHCGDCPACFRRFVALNLNGLSEPWHEKVLKSRTAEVYLERARAGHYSPERCQHILEALRCSA